MGMKIYAHLLKILICIVYICVLCICVGVDYSIISVDKIIHMALNHP